MKLCIIGTFVHTTTNRSVLGNGLNIPTQKKDQYKCYALELTEPINTKPNILNWLTSFSVFHRRLLHV